MSFLSIPIQAAIHTRRGVLILKRRWSETFLSLYPYLSIKFRSNIGREKLRSHYTLNFTHWEPEPRGCMDMDKNRNFAGQSAFWAVWVWISALFGLVSRSVGKFRCGWRVKAVRLGQIRESDSDDTTTQKYEGRAIRILAWIWNGTAPRFGLSDFSETAVEYLRGQEHGISKDDCGSENGLYGPDKRWSTQRRGERFVFREGEPRCIWSGTRACQRTTANAFRESSTADLPDWRDTRRIKKLQKQFELLDEATEEI